MEAHLNQELEQLQTLYTLLMEFFVNYSFQLLGAMLILLVGVLVARKVSTMVLHLCERKNLDITLSRFIAAVVRILIVVMVAIISLGKIGISVTPFVAAVGALSLGAGLAVQGLLSNYGAGLNIIMTRPFVVGDTIFIQGQTGLVDEVRLACTVLVNEDGTRITIPNRHIVGEILHNSASFSLAELSVGIAYSEDPEQVIELLHQALCKLDGVDAEQKPPQVGIDAFADSSINIGVRLWLPTERFMSLRFEANRCIYRTLKEHHIQIPFPQREVRLLQDS
ncbi:mechanosensitive ion channel family protein [Pseudomaricurvus sp. HS19]|uniref:mechanosensitive ion channel family protein n=1 Tax=Pseudomaricurvus sp. HS19 TaxID=2692626 RepID=UPI00136C856B|nr:mechanosensitive ion channel family protein [Pseudomaricurvus sp. HS19]MYM62518.1 mechanosensitive ion channel [Pseudomaricurvus sp. HS19]